MPSWQEFFLTTDWYSNSTGLSTVGIDENEAKVGQESIYLDSRINVFQPTGFATFFATGDKLLNASNWLKTNYESCEGVSVAQSILYSHYTQACDQCGMECVNPASFSKIIRTNFPMLKTRRLGTASPSTIWFSFVHKFNVAAPFIAVQFFVLPFATL